MLHMCAYDDSMIGLQCVQRADSNIPLHTLHAYNSSLIGLQCVQRATATKLSACIKCMPIMFGYCLIVEPFSSLLKCMF